LEELGPEATPARAINLATGLYAASTHILTRLTNGPTRISLLLEIIRDFHQTILSMSERQHQELITGAPSLQDWWTMADGKSGSFFALGCRTGARLATTDPQRIDTYSRFGRHLGILIQIADDAKDLWGDSPAEASDPSRIERSLPVLYAFSVVSPEERVALRDNIREAHGSPGKCAAVHRQVEQSGAPLYLATRIEQHYREAVRALGEPVTSPQARRRLLELMEWTRSPGAV
jgi:geranylgeranyl pyrophosphate synthase